MLLSGARAVLACLLVGSVLFTTGAARADAKQCVLHNNDGAQLRDEHRLLAARDAYRACLAEPGCPEIVRSECDAALADIKAALPTLIVAVLDERGHDLPGVALSLDGKPLVHDGSTIEVDPGPHRLVASKGGLRTQLEVMAIENDINRRVQLVMEPPREKVAAAAAIAPRPANWPMYALGGVAAVGAASFGYFALSGRSDVNALARCKPSCNADDVQAARNKYLAADISLGVSLVALASAGYLFFTRPEAPPARESAFSFDVNPRSDGASLSVRWVQ